MSGVNGQRQYRVVVDSVFGPVEYYPQRGAGGFVVKSPVVTPAEFTITYRPVTVATGTIGRQAVRIGSGPRGLRRSTYRAAAKLAGADYVLRSTGPWTAVLRKDRSTVARVRRIGERRLTVAWTHYPAGPDEAALCHSLCCFAGIGAWGAAGRVVGRTVQVTGDLIGGWF